MWHKFVSINFTRLVHFSKSITIADIFIYWEMDFFHIFNIVKNMTHNIIRGISKIIMQCFKVKMSYCKTHKIGNIMLENVSSYNLDVAPKIGSS